MQVSEDILNAAAKERRRQIAELALEGAKGEQRALSQVAVSVATACTEAQKRVVQATQKLQEIQADGTPGVTDDFGVFSERDQLLRVERYWGKKASAEYVKAHPDCLESAAASAWIQGANAYHGKCIQDPTLLAPYYRADLVKMGQIQSDTWEAQRQWLVNAPMEVILGCG